MRTDQKFDVSHLKYDKRLLEMHYKNKSLSPEEYSEHLQSLPDQFQNADKVKLFDVQESPSSPTIDPADPLASSLSTPGATPVGDGAGNGGGSPQGGGTPFGGVF